jgi:integrase
VDLLGRRLVISESVAEISGEQVFGPPKSYQVRRLPLPRSLQGRLEGHLSRIDADAAALLFPAPRKPDRPFRYTSFRSNYWIPALRAAGLPHVGVHALRHSAAALLISRGASLKELQSIMGHSSAAFTLSVYGHLFDDDLDALADRLDAASRRAAMGRERDGALVAIAGATRETGN